MRSNLKLTGIICWALLFCITASAQNYTDNTSNAGINHSYGTGEFGGGVSFVDYNKDGWDDLTFATSSGQKILVYKNDGNGKFTIDTAMTPNDTSQHKHVTWIDYDKDGDMDLFVSSYSAESRLYRNDGDTALVDVTTSAGVATYSLDGDPVFGVCWGDYNSDGWPDIYITKHSIDDKNYLFRNNKNGTFTDVAAAAGVADSMRQLAFCAAFIDYNNDGYQDLYISYDRYSMANALFKNNGNGTFTDVSSASSADVAVNAMSVGVGDYDNNGYLDIYVTNTTQGNKLIKNNGNGTFTEVSATTKCEFKGIAWAANFLDYDNDRDWDLYVSGMIDQSTQPSSQLYENKNNSTFGVPANDGMDYDTVISFSNAIGDFNNDGYTDIAVSNYTPYNSQLWKNNGGSNNWVKFELEGVDNTKEGIGTWIDVYASGQKYSKYIICGEGFLTQNSYYPIMGLKSDTIIDSINIVWLDGTVDRYYDVPTNKKYKIKEGVTKQPNPKWINKTTVYLCPGDSIVLKPGAFYSYQWSDNSTDSMKVVKAAGTYSVTVTNEYNFDATTPTLTVIMLDTIAADVTVTDVMCYDSTTGEIHISLTKATHPITFQWTGGLTGDTLIQNVKAGNYTLTISDTAQCFSFIKNIQVKQPPKIITNITVRDNPCFGDTKGLVYVAPTGGVKPYTYNWLGGNGTNDSVIDISSGWYRVIITDTNGCVVKDSAAVEQPSLLEVKFNITDISCYGEEDGTLVAIGIGGASSFYNFLWDIGGTSSVKNDLAKGFYGVKVQDANGCIVTGGASINEPDSMYLAYTTKDLGCYNDNSGEISVNVSGGTGAYNYSWTPNQPNSANLTGLSAGTYFLEVIDDNNCLLPETIELTQPDAIMLTTGSIPDSVNLGVGKAWVIAGGGSGGFEYLWSDNQETDTATGLMSGNYTVVVADSMGCSETANVNVGLKSSVLRLSAVLNSINIYPNPASSAVYLDITSLKNINAVIKIVDVIGRELSINDYLIQSGDNTITLDVSSIPNGTYFISIEEEGNKLAEIKLLISH